VILDGVYGESCDGEDDEEYDDDDRDGDVALDHFGWRGPGGSGWLGRVWTLSWW
jgi:hypothetical protein